MLLYDPIRAVVRWHVMFWRSLGLIISTFFFVLLQDSLDLEQVRFALLFICVSFNEFYPFIRELALRLDCAKTWKNATPEVTGRKQRRHIETTVSNAGWAAKVQLQPIIDTW
jgi:hypothetical protein